ncbi:MAG: HAMP domain-containing sensor histidine kinase [Candidatus Melainabacteria bacterium]|nr:HAMP domain-containing sensor histidine kinase [Candidatus Melainabacteria bacterium]
MLSFLKTRLVAKIALTMAIPLVVNLLLYGEMQRQLLALERLTDELTVRRNIAQHTNDIVIANYFAIQSLMQFKMFNKPSDKQSYQDYLAKYRHELDALAVLLNGREDDREVGRNLQKVGRQYLSALDGSQFSPDENNQVGSFFDNLERNRKLKDATVVFLTTLKEVGRKAQKDVEQASLEEAESRLGFRQFCQFVIFANSLVALAIAAFVSAMIVRRINVVRVNSERLARGLSLLSPVSSSDEIGALDKTFRQMAAALNLAREKEKVMLSTIEESRDELAMVINKIPAALFVTDRLGNVESLNAVAEHLFGIDLGYFENAKIDKIFHMKAIEKEGLFARLVAGAQANRGEPQPLFAVGSDGEVVPVNVSVVEYHVAGTVKYLTTVVDETQRLILEQAKGDFFNMVSHDMRTPLTSLSGVLQMTVAGTYGPLPELAVKKLEIARSSSALLLGMINRLLEIGRIESANLELKIEPLDFAALVRQAGDLISPQLEPKSLRLELRAEPCVIAADSHYILEVILNLLTNAIKFSPENALLSMSCRVVREAVPMVLFELVDQGPGVPGDKKEQIFERFWQADNSRDRSSGFGLGLSICRRIILQHGGEIGVRDASAAGATFWFALKAVVD